MRNWKEYNELEFAIRFRLWEYIRVWKCLIVKKGYDNRLGGIR